LPVHRISDGGAKFEEVLVALADSPRIPCQQGIEQGILPILHVLFRKADLNLSSLQGLAIIIPLLRNREFSTRKQGMLIQETGNSREFDAALLIADPIS